MLSLIRACAHTHELESRFFPGSVIADTLTTGQKMPVLASQLRFWRLFFWVYVSVYPCVIEICVKQCAKSIEPRDLRFCTHLYTYLLQCKFEGQVRAKRDKA